MRARHGVCAASPREARGERIHSTTLMSTVYYVHIEGGARGGVCRPLINLHGSAGAYSARQSSRAPRRWAPRWRKALVDGQKRPRTTAWADTARARPPKNRSARLERSKLPVFAYPRQMKEEAYSSACQKRKIDFLFGASKEGRTETESEGANPHCGEALDAPSDLSASARRMSPPHSTRTKHGDGARPTARVVPHSLEPHLRWMSTALMTCRRPFWGGPGRDGRRRLYGRTVARLRSWTDALLRVTVEEGCAAPSSGRRRGGRALDLRREYAALLRR